MRKSPEIAVDTGVRGHRRCPTVVTPHTVTATYQHGTVQADTGGWNKIETLANSK